MSIWNSRAREEHWIRENWPKKVAFKIGKKNILRSPLANPNNELLHSLHIKLGLMKQLNL